MKKKGLIIFLLLLFIAGGSAGFYYYKKSTENHFIGVWEAKKQPFVKETIEISSENEVTMNILSDEENMGYFRTSLIYKHTTLSENKLIVQADKVDAYEIEYRLSKDQLEYMSESELMRMFVDNSIKPYLTDEQIKKYLHIDGDKLLLTVDDSKAINRMLSRTEVDSEDTDLTFSLKKENSVLEISDGSKSKEKMTYTKVVEEPTKKAKRTKETASSKTQESSYEESSEPEEELLTAPIRETTESSEEERVYEPNKFAYYFLVLNDREKREAFIEEHVAEEAQAMFKKHLADEPIYESAGLEDIYSDERENRQRIYQLVSVNEEVQFILEKNENDKIVAVFGPGWKEKTKEEIKELELFIRVRPTMTLRYFVIYYLIETDKEERKNMINENKEYATKEMQELLLAHAEDEFANFNSGSWHESEMKDGTFAIVINAAEDKPTYIITLNQDSQLTHIYGGNFEKLSQEDWDAVMEKKGKLIGAF